MDGLKKTYVFFFQEQQCGLGVLMQRFTLARLLHGSLPIKSICVFSWCWPLSGLSILNNPVSKDMILRHKLGKGYVGFGTSELLLPSLQILWFCWLHQIESAPSKSLAMVFSWKTVICSLWVGSEVLPQVKEFVVLFSWVRVKWSDRLTCFREWDRLLLHQQ